MTYELVKAFEFQAVPEHLYEEFIDRMWEFYEHETEAAQGRKTRHLHVPDLHDFLYGHELAEFIEDITSLSLYGDRQYYEEIADEEEWNQFRDEVDGTFSYMIHDVSDLFEVYRVCHAIGGKLYFKPICEVW